MIAMIIQPLIAAAGYSMLYLIFGGGLGGALLIFVVAKMLGKMIRPTVQLLPTAH